MFKKTIKTDNNQAIKRLRALAEDQNIRFAAIAVYVITYADEDNENGNLFPEPNDLIQCFMIDMTSLANYVVNGTPLPEYKDKSND